MAASSRPQPAPMGPPGYRKTRIQTPICTRSAYRLVGAESVVVRIALLVLVASVLVFLQPAAAAATSGMVLNDFVQHFEPLFYDRADMVRQHGRSKRESDFHLHLRFNAHNRLFKIRLRRSSGSVFADDAILESTQGPLLFDMDAIYEGQLEDDDQSSVSAVVTSGGHLDATVSTASETYYIEPSERYFALAARNGSFPAVIYKASDVIHPETKRPDGSAACASHQFYLKNLEESREWNCANCPRARNQSSPDAVIHHDHDHHDRDEHNSVDGNQQFGRRGLVEFLANRETHHHPEIDETLYSGWERHRSERRKRRRSTIDPRKITCMLYLQADHLFFNKMGSEEACIETMTRHVQRVNAIYRNIDFDGDGQADDINFMIKRIKVHTDQALNEPNYRFPGNYGVEKYLELFSEEDYDAFCLAYMFTYRDFEGGTLGLAWTGDLKNAGGVCEKNGHYRGSLKSLNTGIVTLLNYGKHVPPAVSHVTLAHEIGHNFGSPHDPEQNRDCTPGGEDGNYIMFARATSGDKKNNNKFSPCSLKSINGVLNAKARDAKGCFTEPQMAICGNGVVEPGEQCDCGWEEDCKEKCCYPMRSMPQPGEKPCTLRPYKKCSPSQGPCCTDDCSLRTNFKCRDDNGCRDSASCDGSGPKCPPSNNKPNKTVCNEEFVCFMGECTGSICIAYGLESCQCMPGPGDSPTKACELCCKLPGDDQPCRSSFEWNTPPYDVPDMHAKPGTPCSNYNGYCDVFQKCREVDPSGPLATLRRLLLSDESIASLKRWVEDHWYGVLFIAVGFISVVVAIARVFGKRVRLKMRRHRTSRTANGNAVQTNGAAAATGGNGNGGAAAAAAAPVTTENEQGHIVHPVAIRTKIPLKTKVREKHKRAKKSPAKTTGKSAGKSPKANKIRPSKQLSIFGKPVVKGRKPRKDADQRQRRSGVVSTTEKVQSWLERENPVQETVDSDNESRFPEDNGSARNDHVNAQVLMRNAQSMPDIEQLTTSSTGRRESVGSRKAPPVSGSNSNLMALSGTGRADRRLSSTEVLMRASSNSLSTSTGPRHSVPNRLELPFNLPSAIQSNGVKSSKPTSSKMMRSISECHGPHQPSTKYARSISASAAHEAVADFKRLQRDSKTESHCQLLSKSELELDAKGNHNEAPGSTVVNGRLSPFVPVSATSADPCSDVDDDQLHPEKDAVGGRAERPESLDSITHPVVSVNIPKAGIPKSATDGKLKSTAKSRSSRFTSFEFLNFGARILDKNKDGSGPQRPRTTTGASAAAKRAKEGDGSRMRAKALGLGPVKVVLKWHGTSRFNGLKSKRLPAKSNGEKKSAGRKRVIVYSNPTNTTAMAADAAEVVTKHPKVDHDQTKSKASKAAAENGKTDLKLISRNGTKAATTNIITNPFEEANQVDHHLHPHHPANGTDDVAFRSRRFSMQERASHPPNLSRNLSEMHRAPTQSKSNSSASVSTTTRPSDQKRNRHSWASSRPSVELNGGHSVEHINIDVESEPEECSQ